MSARFVAHVGSGDFKADDVGETHVALIGSSDFTVNRVRGDLWIGSIGSGDADQRAVGGNVDAKSIESGDLRVNGVACNLHVVRIGSGMSIMPPSRVESTFHTRIMAWLRRA